MNAPNLCLEARGEIGDGHNRHACQESSKAASKHRVFLQMSKRPDTITDAHRSNGKQHADFYNVLEDVGVASKLVECKGCPRECRQSRHEDRKTAALGRSFHKAVASRKRLNF